MSDPQSHQDRDVGHEAIDESARYERAAPVEVPEARVVPARRITLAWLIPLLAAVVVVVVLWQGTSTRGPSIIISFPEAHGLRAGDGVVYRGVRVGVVRSVRLDASGTGVLAEATLDRTAGVLARPGTRFWIVRPELSLTRVAGLDTLVGPRYIQADRQALNEQAAPRTHDEERTLFTGLPEPPPGLGGGLTVRLRAERVAGVSAGTGVRYRGVRVGEVRSVVLSPEATHAELVAVIEPEHARLVREDSKFWIDGGTGIDFGWLSGFSVRSAPLESILSGEISFATESADAAAPRPDTTFELHDEPERDWLRWVPVFPTRPDASAEAP